MFSLGSKVLRRLAAEYYEFRRWQPMRSPSDTRIFYGFDTLPHMDKEISGGIVKCLDLNERFPNHVHRANLLYHISSALPPRAELQSRWARLRGAPVVLNQNGVAYSAWYGSGWEKANRLNSRLHSNANFVVYQSRFCKRCAELFLGARTGPSTVLYNPVDTTKFRPPDGISSRRPVLLVAGSHHEAYRVKNVISSLPIVKKIIDGVTLIIAGRLVWSSDAIKETRQWIQDASLADTVRIIGPYSQNDAPDLLRASDVLVHLKVQDPCPRLVVEAMACGVPIVYSSTGGLPEIVGDSAGYGIPGEENFETIQQPSPDAVAQAIIQVINRREAMGKSARNRSLSLFSVEHWLNEHQRIFSSMVTTSQ